MQKLIEKIKFNMDIEGYAQSKGFIGFFEKFGKYQHGMDDVAINFFLNYFYPSFYQGYVISTLFVDIDFIKSYSSASIKKETPFYIDYLSRHSLIQVINNQYSEIEQEELCKNLINMNKYMTKELCSFNVFDLSIISSSLISWGAARGHLFYYLPKYELIIYPHDDVGFGFINISDTADENNYFALNFLKEVNKLDGFIAHLNREKY